MEVADHLPSRMKTAAEMIATSTEVISSNVPICPPPCTCPDCQTYYYTSEEQNIDRFHYTEVLTDGQARSILARDVKDMNESRTYLREAIHRAGDQILNRWRKRTQPKRAALLRQVEPDLPEHKGLIAELDYSGMSWQEGRATKYRKYHLIPYLDIDTLIRSPSTLIGLLNARAKHSAEDWAPFDYEQLRSAWGLGLLAAQFNAGTVQMYGPGYGTLTRWEKVAAHRFDTIGFPRARQVIEAQATLGRLLRRIVEHLLEGIPPDEHSGSTKWDELIDTGLKTTGDGARWSAFVHQPFTGPPHFDVDALTAEVQARFDVTNDHLWLLQTEPSYLKRYMRKVAQMQVFESVSRRGIGVTITNGEIMGDINLNRFWLMTLLEFKHLQGLYHRYRDSIIAGSPLPKKIDGALGALELILANEIHTRAKQLDAIMAQRPGFRNMYEAFEMTGRASDDVSKLEGITRVKAEFTKKGDGPSSGVAHAYRKERMWWIFTQLGGPPDSETRFRYAMLLDMLDDHLASSSADERGRLDEVHYEKLSDYVILLQLLWAVRMHRPRNSNHMIEQCAKTEDRLYWRVLNHERPSALNRTDFSSTTVALAAFQAAVPPSGQRNLEWLKSFEHLHGTLQNYWRAVSELCRSGEKRKGVLEADIETMMQPLSFWKDVRYTTRLDQKRQYVLAESQRPKIPENEDMFLPLPNISEQSPKLKTEPSKTKSKTRGEARPDEHTEDVGAVDTGEPPQSQITVPKRSYATFRYMFPTSLEERQKAVDWDTFVASMADAGFTASNGGGSIVTFEKLDGGGRIIFHRPHPNPSIDPILLQSMGRRLNKWFGLTRDSFTLVSKPL
ncbi:hypothetical protein NX059_001334 [Plenodomus lindquistii]|nr:hypothetical protein NX059_001334 [Plenodomus lindquistii]